MEINQGYAIRRVIAFDNECGFVLGENPKAPDPYVTWQFNMRGGERNYFWGHSPAFTTSGHFVPKR